MDSTLASPHHVPWRLLILAPLAALNFLLLALWLEWALRHGPWDFYIYRMASFRLFDGTMYEWGAGYIYPYSPLFAWLFAPIGALGIWFWRALHLACVALIPSWPIRIAVLLSWGFWMDTWEGNVTAFFMLAGYWAVRGNRIAGWAFILFALLVPKPQFLAGIIWLLWREPAYRAPMVVAVPVYGLLVLATGYGFDWLSVLLGASHDLASPFNFLPSRIIGWWWLLIGVPLGLWMIRKGHPGWAGLALSLYAGPPQLLLLVMERTWPSWLTPPLFRERRAPTH